MQLPLLPQRVVNQGGKDKIMDMAAVEGADAAGGMDMPPIAHRNSRSGEASHFMEVDFGEVRCDLESVNVITIGNRYDLPGHASEAVVVG